MEEEEEEDEDGVEKESSFPDGIVNGLYASGRPFQTPTERVAQERILRYISFSMCHSI